jgi:hypothetical protein
MPGTNHSRTLTKRTNPTVRRIRVRSSGRDQDGVRPFLTRKTTKSILTMPWPRLSQILRKVSKIHRSDLAAEQIIRAMNGPNKRVGSCRAFISQLAALYYRRLLSSSAVSLRQRERGDRTLRQGWDAHRGTAHRMEAVLRDPHQGMRHHASGRPARHCPQ